jgi:methylglutaconyl-CoA hydratase
MADELVHLEIAGGVGKIVLDSPHNRNALSQQLVSDLSRHLTTALASEAVRVIVLSGTGTVFCSGADLKEQRVANEAGDRPTGPGDLPEILATMWDSPKPIVGRINGAARAGGIGLLAACDIAVAPETATFAFSEVRLGVIPAIISVVVIPRIGESRALELFMTGDTFDGTAAANFGLVNQAVSQEDLDSAVEQYVASLLKGAPGALQGCKQLVRDVPLLAMDQAFAETKRRSAAYFASAEALEGMKAFAEKRLPRWTGEV